MEGSLEIYKQLIINGQEHMLDIKEVKSIIEALLFTAGEALSIQDISEAIQMDKRTIRNLLDEMIDEYKYEKRGIQIISFGGKYQLSTRPEHMEYIRRLLGPQNKQSLSRAALETMAIIAYNQPVTRQKIDLIRGVKNEKIISSLVEKKLVKDVGRLDGPGRPILYGTTDEFLRYFGLKDLSELPKTEELIMINKEDA